MNTSPMVQSTPLRPIVRKQALQVSKLGLALIHLLGWLSALAGTSGVTWAVIHYNADTPYIVNFDELFAVTMILILCVIIPGVIVANYKPKKS